MHKFLLALLVTPLLALAEPAQPQWQKEVDHLMGYLQHSGCQFQRNGSWYPPEEAVSHLQRKYRYLLERDLVSSAEQFIARAASQSSVSGRAYQVRCPNTAPQPSADWLQTELKRYRQAR